MFRVLIAGLSLAACSPAEPPLLIDGREDHESGRISVPNPPIVDGEGRVAIESVWEMARAHAQLLYGSDCGTVILPDRAFEPIEISGDDRPEYAVLFGRATCAREGSANRWLGTGGANVQIWLATGQPRLILDHSMHGFSPGPRSLLSSQHGGFCPGGAGPNLCLVQYEWNERDNGLEPVHRDFFDGSSKRQPPRMSYEYEAISR